MSIIAIDVSKLKLDVYYDLDSSFITVANNLQGIKELLKKSKEEDVFVFEATGGYENGLLFYLVEQGKTIFRCCGKRVRQFANSQGKAKTDKLDAEMIAKYAKSSKLEPFSLADKSILELRELNTRRNQAISMHRKESNRLEHKPSKIIEKMIKQKVKSYQKEIDMLNELIEEHIKTNKKLEEKISLMVSMPGIGVQTAVTILCELPEIGNLDRGSVAAISGLAPFNKDSGTLSGRRKTKPSRQKIKSVLYMCSMISIKCNPRIKSFYQRLKSKGKSGKLALVACMRKMIITLNAMIKKESFWMP